MNSYFNYIFKKYSELSEDLERLEHLSKISEISTVSSAISLRKRNILNYVDKFMAIHISISFQSVLMKFFETEKDENQDENNNGIVD